MAANPYVHWLEIDNDLCSPVINQHQIGALIGQVHAKVELLLGPGPTPQVFLDLEHLQVADYGAFEGVSAAQRTFIADLNRRAPIRAEDMVFLALRSLIQFSWEEPESEKDIHRAAAYENVLNKTIELGAQHLGAEFTSPEARLSYWGRMAFLTVMVNLPGENVARFGLEGVACTLAKRAKFNATTFALEGAPVISMDYALEPILKHLNRFLLHYFSTREMAGPRRLSRAWEGIVPTVLHFWSDVAAPHLLCSPAIIYGEEMAATAHAVTASQLSFVLMHELGHVALDHPTRLRAAAGSSDDVKPLRHEFECGADVFALGLMRSRLIRDVRAETAEPEVLDAGAKPLRGVLASLQSYQEALGAVYLLFTYMDFVRRAGELLRDLSR